MKHDFPVFVNKEERGRYAVQEVTRFEFRDSQVIYSSDFQL